MKLRRFNSTVENQTCNYLNEDQVKLSPHSTVTLKNRK